jgi:hypothetical protein
VSYLKANIFWKNFIKNVLPKAESFRIEKGSAVNKRERGEKSISLKLLGLLIAIIGAALLLSAIGAWWFKD